MLISLLECFNEGLKAHPSWLLFCKLSLSVQEFVSCKLKDFNEKYACGQNGHACSAAAPAWAHLLWWQDAHWQAGPFYFSRAASLPRSVCGCTVVRAAFPQGALPPNLHMGLFALEHTCWLSCVIKQMLLAWIKRGQSCTSISATVNTDHTQNFL